jgi:heme exporter protein A
MEGGDYSMSAIRLHADGLSKTFNRRQVFHDISFTLTTPCSLSITGKNGAGKSTLAKIIAGVLSATSGTLVYELGGKTLEEEERKAHIGFVSPYLNFYEEFSAMENIFLLLRMRSDSRPSFSGLDDLLKRFNLWERRDDAVRGYSTGMKQRLKYVFALVHSPSVLILDEPTTNLDNDGIKVVEGVVQEQKRSSLLVIATNDSAEAGWCEKNIKLQFSGLSK